jgi:hypothetical protein
MSTILNIEYHLSMIKIVVHLIVRRLYSISGCCNSLTLHVLVDLNRLHRVRKALLVVCNLDDVWLLYQLIHQMSSAWYGRLQVQCILTKMCIYYLKLGKLIAYPPHDCFHHMICQVDETSKLMVINHQLFPSLKFDTSSTYHMIWNNLHLHHNKSWFAKDNNLALVVIFMIF